MKPRLSIFAAVVLFAVPCVWAQLEPDGANDADYVALGSQYAGRTVYVRGVSLTTGNSATASGILLDPLNVLTSAHYATGVTVTKVGNGSSITNSPGATSTVSSVSVYPGYVNNGQFNSPDIVILHLSTPLGNGIQSIAPVANGQSVILTGFGFHGTPSGGVSFDGALRGWNGTIDNTGLPFNVSGDHYDSVYFLGIPGNGNTLGGSSGGGVFNSSGELVGMIESQYGGTGPAGAQQFLNFLKSPGLLAWISTNLTPYLVLNTASTNMVLQWNDTFALQSATNVAGPFVTVTNASSPYTNTMTAPQQFFRLASTNAP